MNPNFVNLQNENETLSKRLSEFERIIFDKKVDVSQVKNEFGKSKNQSLIGSKIQYGVDQTNFEKSVNQSLIGSKLQNKVDQNDFKKSVNQSLVASKLQYGVDANSKMQKSRLEAELADIKNSNLKISGVSHTLSKIYEE